MRLYQLHLPEIYHQIAMTVHACRAQRRQKLDYEASSDDFSASQTTRAESPSGPRTILMSKPFVGKTVARSGPISQKANIPSGDNGSKWRSGGSICIISPFTISARFRVAARVGTVKR